MFRSEDEIIRSLASARPREAGEPVSTGSHGFPEAQARRLAALAKPSVYLETRRVDAEAEIALGATKLGGRPDLPSGMAWPIRPTYPDAEKRVARHREDLEAPDSRWSWAPPEQRQAFREDFAQMVKVAEGPFPLGFLGQFNFAEMWASGPLDPDFPKSGLLSVFYDVLETPWGFDPADRPGWSVLYTDGEVAELARLDTPADLAALERYRPIAPMSCSGQARFMPLPYKTALLWDLGLPDAQRGLYFDWWMQAIDPRDGTESHWNRHVFGGWPVPIQGDMQLECALVAAGHYCGNAEVYRDPETAAVRASAGDWVFVAQIGSDDDAGMMWGDLGNIYVWIRREDLVARRFEAARLVLQCS